LAKYKGSIAIFVMQDKKQPVKTVSGVVTESLPNTFFKVKIEGEENEILTYLAGKMRLHRIRVLIGDKVSVELEPYGGKGRIVKRL
jgi:translation initiation factor IF-1